MKISYVTNTDGWMDGWMGGLVHDRGVQVPAEAENFSFHHRVQTGSGTRPASYPMGTRGSFPGAKAAGA
jgi:hypothetical protein